MHVLIIGGTGLISTGVIKSLLKRGAQVTMYNRGKRENTLPPGVSEMRGDRNDAAVYEAQFKSLRFDAVIDMFCFESAQAESDVRAFGGRCEQFIFCSSVCAYGVKVPPSVLVDETFPQEPFTAYGRNKRDCEQVFLAAHRAGAWKATIIRPSCTYGPGGQLIDMLEGNPVTWDRVARGLPVLMAGDGLGLWQATHRDDCGKAFAYAVLNPKTYGEGYNATLDEVFTWNDYYRLAAQSLGKPAKVIYMSADWIIRRGRGRFGLLADVTRFHGAYTSAKAKRDMPEFRCEIPFARGAAETLADCRRRGAWPDGAADALYQGMVDEALKAGMEPVEL